MPDTDYKPYEKSGQVQGSVGQIILIVISIGTAVLVMIFLSFLSGETYRLNEDKINAVATVTDVLNENVSVPLNAVTNTANDWIHGSSLSIVNATDNAEIGLGNFTIDYTAGTLNYTGGSYGTNITINYTHGDVRAQEVAKSAIAASFEALETTGDYLPIIVIALIISVIFGILFVVYGMSMSRGKNMGGGGAL